MKGVKTFAFACILLVIGLVAGGFLGVSGTTGPLADRQLFLFVDPYGQVLPNVTPHTQIHWLKLDDDGRTIVPVQDIKFKGAPPCEEGNPEQGICTINVKDGWHPYDCPDSCSDPTMPVGSRTKGGGSGSGGGTGGSQGGSLRALPQPGSSPNLAAAFVIAPSGEIPLNLRLKLAYLRFAAGFDDVLHAIWSGDDKPVEPVYPPPHLPARPPMFPSGPLVRESVVCDAYGKLTVPADLALFSGGATAVVPGVSIIWDSAGAIDSDFEIQDAAGSVPQLKDVCDKPPPYTAAAETAGVCHLKAAPSSVSYQVLVKSGRCASTTPYPVTISVGQVGSPLR